MDIQVQENPPIEHGDLIFVDDMIRGRQLMVVECNILVEKDGKKQLHRCALVDLQRGRMVDTFYTLANLEKHIENWMCTVRKSADYTMILRKK